MAYIVHILSHLTSSVHYIERDLEEYFLLMEMLYMLILVVVK